MTTDFRTAATEVPADEARQMLARFREDHRIDPEYPRDTHLVNWCRHDGVRIHPVRGGFRHDLAEVRALGLAR